MSGLVVALILILMSIRNYQDLLDALVYNEQKHLLTIADSTAKAIETYFTNEERSLEIFVSDSRFREYFDSLTTSNDRGLTAPIEMYYTIGYPRVQNIEVADANGHILDRYPHFSNDSDMETDISQESVVSKVIETEAKAYGTTFFENGESYIYLSYPIVDDDAFVGFIRIKLSTDVIYKRYVEPIKTGNKGYASVKTSDGVFLMHPKSSQIGQNVLEIRRKEFPDYDWSELEALFEKQMLGLSGSEVYHSVWVTDDEPKRTLKFNGYTPAYVGDDFWIVTVSSDYEEAVRGIKKNYYYTILVIAFIFMSIVFSFIYVYMIKQKDKELKNKSRYLDEVRKLNAELEEDIEQRKKLEIELLEKMEENKKKEVLMLHQSRYVAMGEMIGNIAHQWRQPLNTLTMILSNIEDLIGDDEIDAEFCDQLMDKARVLIRNMSETIEDFRYFVKPKVKNENFYVYRCVDTTLELCEERLNIEDVHVDVSGIPMYGFLDRPTNYHK